MQFNPNPNKQANEVTFSRKSNSNNFPYPSVKFNENDITKCSYKSFIRPHPEYGDILYDKRDNESFQNKIEKVQYKGCLAITGAIQGTSREKLYEELGLYSLAERRGRNKLIVF